MLREKTEHNKENTEYTCSKKEHFEVDIKVENPQENEYEYIKKTYEHTFCKKYIIEMYQVHVHTCHGK